jgi:hypothetical protein
VDENKEWALAWYRRQPLKSKVSVFSQIIIVRKYLDIVVRKYNCWVVGLRQGEQFRVNSKNKTY